MLKPGDMVLVKKGKDGDMTDIPAVVVRVNEKSVRVETPYCERCDNFYCNFNSGLYPRTALVTR